MKDGVTAMTQHEIQSGTATRLGARHDGEGVNFAVFSEHAARMELCLFAPDGKTEQARIPLPEKSGPHLARLCRRGCRPGSAIRLPRTWALRARRRATGSMPTSC